jgi:hypothetical protein
MFDGIARARGTDFFRIADQLTADSATTGTGPGTSSTTRCSR